MSHKKRRKKNALHGLPAKSVTLGTSHEGWKLYGLLVGSTIVGYVTGVAIGNKSFYASLPVAVLAYWKKNPFAAAAALGMALAPVKKTEESTTQGVDGFKEILEGAKKRVSSLINDVKEKVLLKPAEATNGLGEDEQVTYFVNPYKGTGEIDMSAMDKVLDQVKAMNQKPVNDIDREF